MNEDTITIYLKNKTLTYAEFEQLLARYKQPDSIEGVFADHCTITEIPQTIPPMEVAPMLVNGSFVLNQVRMVKLIGKTVGEHGHFNHCQFVWAKPTNLLGDGKN